MVNSLSALGYSAELLRPSDVLQHLEPAIEFGPECTHVAYLPDEGFVFGAVAVGDVLRRAQATGAEIRLGEPVREVTTASQRVRGVTLQSGEFIGADIVVAASGTGTSDLVTQVGGVLPLVSPAQTKSPAVGLLVITKPATIPLDRVLIADELMIRPDGGGRLILHGFAQDELIDAATPAIPLPAAAETVMQLATRHLSGLEGTGIEAIRVGTRPLPVDDLPVVGWLPSLEGLYVMVTHSGVTLGPLLAELATSELMGRGEAQALASFRPDRFR